MLANTQDVLGSFYRTIIVYVQYTIILKTIFVRCFIRFVNQQSHTVKTWKVKQTWREKSYNVKNKKVISTHMLLK